jgi:hypothetical protein
MGKEQRGESREMGRGGDGERGRKDDLSFGI